MAKKSTRLFSAAIILTLVLITTTAFINKGENISSGGGIANGHLFNYNAIENKGKINGRFSWDGEDYEIVCVVRNNNTALLHLNNGMAVEVKDIKNGDRITAPFAMTPDCAIMDIKGDKFIHVDGGNITVYR